MITHSSWKQSELPGRHSYHSRSKPNSSKDLMPSAPQPESQPNHDAAKLEPNSKIWCHPHINRIPTKSWCCQTRTKLKQRSDAIRTSTESQPNPDAAKLEPNSNKIIRTSTESQPNPDAAKLKPNSNKNLVSSAPESNLNQIIMLSNSNRTQTKIWCHPHLNQISTKPWCCQTRTELKQRSGVIRTSTESQPNPDAAKLEPNSNKDHPHINRIPTKSRCCQTRTELKQRSDAIRTSTESQPNPDAAKLEPNSNKDLLPSHLNLTPNKSYSAANLALTCSIAHIRVNIPYINYWFAGLKLDQESGGWRSSKATAF